MYFLGATEGLSPNRTPFHDRVTRTAQNPTELSPSFKTTENNHWEYLNSSTRSLPNDYASPRTPRGPRNHFYYLGINSEEVNTVRASLRTTPRADSSFRRDLGSPCRHASSSRMTSRGQLPRRSSMRDDLSFSTSPRNQVEVIDVLALCRLHDVPSPQISSSE
ncbi:hypothetical protein SK128_011534, partial [Halocaridina rubra]